MEIKKRKKRKKTLFWMFLEQIILMALMILGELALFLGWFVVQINNGAILPANYAEQYLTENIKMLEQAPKFDESLIPHTCSYGIFDKQGVYRQGNFSDEALRTARKLIKNPDNTRIGNKVITRSDGYWVFLYTISPQFANPDLYRLIPRFEDTFILIFLLVMALLVTLNAIWFGKRMRKQLKPLMEEIDQVKRRELDLHSNSSKIKEFDDMLAAFGDMKEELSRSLKAEWEAQQRSKENISALAHDIKTPLTIIKGNAELMREETDITELYQQAEVVNLNADKIEDYLKLLMAEARGKELGHQDEALSLQELVEAMEAQSRNLCQVRQVPIIVTKHISQAVVSTDSGLLQRAVLNLVENAVEYTDKRQGIRIRFSNTGRSFRVEIEDFGTGFSKEALRHAKEKFYTNRTERSGGHYGMGMHFASEAAKRYGGEVEFYNKENNAGAVVSFTAELMTQDENLS